MILLSRFGDLLGDLVTLDHDAAKLTLTESQPSKPLPPPPPPPMHQESQSGGIVAATHIGADFAAGEALNRLLTERFSAPSPPPPLPMDASCLESLDVDNEFARLKAELEEREKGEEIGTSCVVGTHVVEVRSNVFLEFSKRQLKRLTHFPF